MSWIVSSPLTWLQRFCLNVLKRGPVPRHVAFIMDGNRRFARKMHVQRQDGHVRGFEKLSQTLQWCRAMGIREVTVYAFSIENFSRSREEVDALMELAREKYRRLMEERDTLMAEGVCIRVIGNLELVPPDLRRLIAEAVLLTRDNSRVFLNIAFAYTSRDEIASAVRTVVEGVNAGALEICDVDEHLLSSCLYTGHGSNPDLLIRTSGESRLSDFLLWQIRNTNIHFTNVLWPEFSFWHFLAIIFKYQRCYRYMETVKIVDTPKEPSERVHTFLKCVELNRLKILENYKIM